MDTVSRVREMVLPLVSEAGAELYDLELTGGVLRLTLDRPGGVDIDLIGSVTRAVSRALDEVDPIPGEYTLEVSSPGLERPLRTPHHFERAIGDLASVKTRAGADGERRLKGVVMAAGEHSFTLRPTDAPDDGSDDRVIDYESVERARTIFEWGPAPKPTGPPSKKSSDKKSSDKKASRS